MALTDYFRSLDQAQIPVPSPWQAPLGAYSVGTPYTFGMNTENGTNAIRYSNPLLIQGPGQPYLGRNASGQLEPLYVLGNPDQPSNSYYYLQSQSPSGATLSRAPEHNDSFLTKALKIAVPAALAWIGGGAAGLWGAPGAAAGAGTAEEAAALGIQDVGSAAAGGTAAGTSGVAAAGGESAGGGMWDWLDSIDSGAMSSSPQGLNASLGGGVGLDPTVSFTEAGLNPVTGGAAFNSALSPELQAVLGAGTAGAASSSGVWDLITKYGTAGLNAAKSLLGGSGGSPSIPGPFGNSLLNGAFDATPFLLALHEANSQSGDINNVLNQINADAYRKSVLDPYDLQTSTQRAALSNDLGLRGVAGSSFGNQALDSFDYMHGLERGDMASRANLAAAGLEGQLINQRNTNRNLLLGAGLNASARLFSPQTDPFGISYLKQLGLLNG